MQENLQENLQKYQKYHQEPQKITWVPLYR